MQAKEMIKIRENSQLLLLRASKAGTLIFTSFALYLFIFAMPLKNLAAFILCLLLSAAATAQSFTLNDIPLQWKNFAIKDGLRNHPFSAKTGTKLLYTFITKVNKNGSGLLTLHTSLSIDEEKTWVKKEFMEKSSPEQKQALLNHERGHFMIALIAHRKLQHLFANYSFPRNPKPAIDSLRKVIGDEADALNLQYDEETNHMLIADKQQEWQDRLLRMVNELYAGDKKIRTEADIEVPLVP